MPPRSLAIVGIDGTGKSTICRSLFRHLSGSSLRVRGFSSLEIFADPDLPLGDLSRIFDLLSGLADERQSPTLKAMAMVLGMTLFGPVERFLEDTYAPDWILTERHPVIDSLVYASFYLSRLEPVIDPVILGAIDARFEAEGWRADRTWERIHEWIALLPALEGHDGDFRTLPGALRALFDVPAEPLLARLGSLYRTDLPDHVLLLTLPVGEAEQRIEGRQHADGKARDLHETPEALALIQGAYHQACDRLQVLSPRMRVETHQALGVPIETVLRTLMLGVPSTLAEATP